MKRGTKLLILLAAFLLLAGAGLLVTKQMAEKNDVSQESSASLFEITPEDIKSFSWTIIGETVKIERANDEWVLADDPDAPLKKLPLVSMVYCICNLRPIKTIDNPDDLSVYGLAESMCTVSITTNTNTYDITIGTNSSMSDSVYFSTGDGKVYLTNAGLADAFSYPLANLIETEPIPNMDSLSALAVTTADREYTMINKGDAENPVWYLSENGTEKAMDAEFAASTAYMFQNLVWSGCANYKPTEEELASTYELIPPLLTLSLTYDSDGTEETFTVELGKDIGQVMYARIAGSNMVYYLDSVAYERLLNVSADRDL